MSCFSLQVFLLFQLYCGFVLPIANAAPTHRNGRAEPQLLLNEVALNYGLHSFIELYAPNGLAGNLFNRHLECLNRTYHSLRSVLTIGQKYGS